MTPPKDQRRQRRHAPLPRSLLPPDPLVVWRARRRSIYLGASALGLVVLLITGWLELARPSPNVLLLGVYGMLASMCAWVMAWLLSGRDVRTAERVVLGCNVVAVLGQFYVAPLSSSQDPALVLFSAHGMLLALSIVAHLMFPLRQAGALSLACYLVGVLLSCLALMQRGGDAITWLLLRVHLSSGPLLLLILVLAWYRSRFWNEYTGRLLLERQARTDPLTGLPNRRVLYQEIEQLLLDLGRGSPGGVILLDLDHFKAINDTHGHPTGDDVLVQTGQLLRLDLRSEDILGRWGGEEFMVVLPATPAEGIGLVAERLRARLQNTPHPVAGIVTASFGVAAARPGDTFGELTTRADGALYRAKQGGRNRVVQAAEAAIHPDGVARLT
ncbi:diguanylate cyclase [Deinococcus geothermalis DSM 11300]|uniref:Diguanylate cyclase n=1 Tax=Deinococcus geothermalis (strain DSM 11300 / CIP 105573 / AG-3a) TaxID=319795 RepID=Q1J085_DEIGD|nr:MULTISPECIES: GGDEF domain-containing protein [Deinococcus]ABF45099.1 diguanylate cyclase [Deinococcus geothermalis DSM 11300]MBI0444385.1 GGDEF domain-containing protein [Deinococcus sp. DB0503]